jgi:hypothetical protein
MDIAQLATVVATTLTPYLPTVMKAGSWVLGEAKEHASTITTEIWSLVKPRLQAAPKLEATARVVAVDPADREASASFAKALAVELAKDAGLQESLANLLSKDGAAKAATAQIIADNGALVERVRQEVEGNAKATTSVKNNSTARDIVQIAKK